MSQVLETSTAEIKLCSNGIPYQVNGYKITDELGEGALSRVYRCTKECSSSVTTEYALKVFNKSILKRKREFKRVNGRMVVSTAFQKVQKEVAILKKISHLNLTRLHEVIDSPEDDKMFLVLEYVPHGQIMYWYPEEQVYRNTKTNSVLSENAAKKCITDIVQGIEYIHANNICHRDIKPENILHSRDDDVYKLADFGVAHLFEDQDVNMKLKNTEGTYHFLAPESLSGQYFDPYQADIWGLGITLYALVFGIVPFGQGAQGGAEEIMDAIRTSPLVFPSGSGSTMELKDLLGRMLDRNLETRITVAELKNHPWLTTMEGKSYPSIELVQVSMNEIDLAFTPINNFYLMTKIKIKMHQSLKRVRLNLLIKRDSVEISSDPTASPKSIVSIVSPTIRRRKQSRSGASMKGKDSLPSLSNMLEKRQRNDEEDRIIVAKFTLKGKKGKTIKTPTVNTVTIEETEEQQPCSIQ